jgi:hypothetical protein
VPPRKGSAAQAVAHGVPVGGGVELTDTVALALFVASAWLRATTWQLVSEAGAV